MAGLFALDQSSRHAMFICGLVGSTFAAGVLVAALVSERSGVARRIKHM